MRRTLCGGLVSLLVLAALGALGVAGASAAAMPEPSSDATFGQLVHAVGGTAAGTSDPRFGYLLKLDSHLQAVAASDLGSRSGHPGVAANAVAQTEDQQGVDATAAGDVIVDVYVNGSVSDDRRRAARVSGMQVTATSDREPQRMVEGRDARVRARGRSEARHGAGDCSPRSRGLEHRQRAVAGRRRVARAGGALCSDRPEPASRRLVSVVDQRGRERDHRVEGDGRLARAPSGSSRDDPAPRKDEGRAMAEIVYDEAPGISSIDFVTADGCRRRREGGSIDGLVAARRQGDRGRHLLLRRAVLPG